MPLTMERKWIYSQAKSMKRLDIDVSLRNGICKSITYDWLKRKLAGAKTSPEVIDSNIYQLTAMQRAGVGKKGRVAEVVKMLEGGQSARKTQVHLKKLPNNTSVENIAMLARRDGLTPRIRKSVGRSMGDLIAGLPPDFLEEFDEEDEEELDGLSNQFAKDHLSGGPLAIYYSLRATGEGHGVGYFATTKGTSFFDPNFGEYYAKNPVLAVLWVLAGHIPQKYGLRFDMLQATELQGIPRDAEILRAG